MRNVFSAQCYSTSNNDCTIVQPSWTRVTITPAGRQKLTRGSFAARTEQIPPTINQILQPALLLCGRHEVNGQINLRTRRYDRRRNICHTSGFQSWFTIKTTNTQSLAVVLEERRDNLFAHSVCQSVVVWELTILYLRILRDTKMYVFCTFTCCLFNVAFCLSS